LRPLQVVQPSEKTGYSIWEKEENTSKGALGDKVQSTPQEQSEVDTQKETFNRGGFVTADTTDT